MPKTYLVCGSYYGGERLERTLKLLRREEGKDIAILVNEQRGSDRVPSGFAQIHNALINCAFADPNCQRVWIIGDDAIPGDADTLYECETQLYNDPSIGAIFPTECWPSSNDPNRLETIIPFEGRLVDVHESCLTPTLMIEMPYPSMACTCIRREAWEAVGPMDVSLGRGYGEDVDWGVRCWQAGFRVVNYRNVYFIHEQGATYNQLMREGKFAEGDREAAARACQKKWPFLWTKPWTEVMQILKKGSF